jgi:hypothetical protein
MESVRATDSSGGHVTLTPIPLPYGGTMLPNVPSVTVVIRSDQGLAVRDDGPYMGFLELSARDAHILSEELRKAAEVAARG